MNFESISGFISFLLVLLSYYTFKNLNEKGKKRRLKEAKQKAKAWEQLAKG